MAKIKPDPETQRIVFKDVPSDIAHIFEELVMLEIERYTGQNKGHFAYEKMSRQKKTRSLLGLFHQDG